MSNDENITSLCQYDEFLFKKCFYYRNFIAIITTLYLENDLTDVVVGQEGDEDLQDDAAVSVPIELDVPQDDDDGASQPLPEGCGLAVAEGGGVLSPLSGAYLLIVLAEPISEKHKDKMLQKLRQGMIIFIE